MSGIQAVATQDVRNLQPQGCTNARESLGALADSTRRHTLEILAADKSETPTSLAAHFGVTRQAMSRHMSILREAGLVSCRSVGREMIYRLRPEQVRAAAAWLEQLASVPHETAQECEDDQETGLAAHA